MLLLWAGGIEMTIGLKFEIFSDAELVVDTKRAVAEERRAMLAVLDRIKEIHTRSLHLALGFSSLHAFCVTELKYSDGAAHRRISAMRLCDDLPKARKAIADGALSLSNAASLQTFFRKSDDAPVTEEAKEELLEMVQGKSKAQCDRIFYPEQKGVVVRFLADDETLALLKRLSELTAIGEQDRAALIKRVAAIALRTIDPLGERATADKPTMDRSTVTVFPASSSPTGHETAKENPAEQASLAKLHPTPARPLSTPARPLPTSPSPSRYIPVAVERSVWARDGGQCTYVDSLTRRRCSSRFGLQLDHVRPLACGGPSTKDNLRLLCAGHNRLAAQRVFGHRKMASFASS